MLLVACMVQVQKLPDFLEAEAEALAAQYQFQPGPVALGEKPLLTFPDREQKLFSFVESQGAGRDVIGLAHFANGHHFFGHVSNSHHLRHGHEVRS